MRRVLKSIAFLIALTAVAWAANEVHQGRALLFPDGIALKFGTDRDFAVSATDTTMTILPAADDSLVVLGDGATDLDIKTFGDIPTSYTYWDASANELRFYGPTRFTNNSLSTRYQLRWVAGQRGKPGINADINSATEATREPTDPDFEILGTNAVSADVAFNAEGGITLTTHGASADSTILLPHLATNQSGWKNVTWGTDKQTEWEADITTGGAITTATIWAGLKLTNTPTIATDNDQAFFYYDSATNSGKWEAVTSINNVDTETDTGVTAALSTRYHMKVAIDSSRLARLYLNGVLVKTTAALTDATDLIPYIGVKQTAGSITRSVVVHGQAISRIPD